MLLTVLSQSFTIKFLFGWTIMFSAQRGDKKNQSLGKQQLPLKLKDELDLSLDKLINLFKQAIAAPDANVFKQVNEKLFKTRDSLGEIIAERVQDLESRLSNLDKELAADFELGFTSLSSLRLDVDLLRQELQLALKQLDNAVVDLKLTGVNGNENGLEASKNVLFANLQVEIQEALDDLDSFSQEVDKVTAPYSEKIRKVSAVKV